MALTWTFELLMTSGPTCSPWLYFINEAAGQEPVFATQRSVLELRSMTSSCKPNTHSAAGFGRFFLLCCRNYALHMAITRLLHYRSKCTVKEQCSHFCYALSHETVNEVNVYIKYYTWWQRKDSAHTPPALKHSSWTTLIPKGVNLHDDITRISERNRLGHQ